MIGKTREMDYLGRNWPLYIIIIRKIEENYYVIYAIISLLCSTRQQAIERRQRLSKERRADSKVIADNFWIPND